jgi:hypothetical protein
VGHLRQHVNLLGYALLVNSLSLLLANSNASPPLPQAAQRPNGPDSPPPPIRHAWNLPDPPASPDQRFLTPDLAR